MIFMNSERIKELREECEITQKDFSKRLGCTRSAYSLWEINKNTIPLYYLNRLSNLLDVNIDYIAGLSDRKYLPFKKIDINRISLGKKIKQARRDINYTQDKLALKLNTTHSVISAYESGKTAVPTLFMIEIAKITNRSLNWFLDKEKD